MHESNIPFFWFGGGLACETRGEKKDKKNMKIVSTHTHILDIDSITIHRVG